MTDGSGEPTPATPSQRVLHAATELAAILLEEESLDSILDKIAALAKRSITGADEVSVTVVGDRATSVAFTGKLAIEADERQYELGEGPCLDASRTNRTMQIEDFGSEERWPAYVPRAAAVGAGSSISVPLPIRDADAALNVYATRPRAFDDDVVAEALTFATFAAAAVTNAEAYRKTAELAEQLDQAMANRAVIEQAKGIIMAEQGCSPDEAFEALRGASQRSNRKLRDIARALVEKQSAPGDGDDRPAG